MNTNLVGVLLATILTLVLSDIWISALFGAVFELIRHRESILKVSLSFVSSLSLETQEFC